MTRFQGLLFAVVAAELAVGGYLVARDLGRPAPPLPDLSAVDPLAAEEIRGLAARCRGAREWAALAEVYLAMGFFPEAEACYRHASALDPANADVTFKHAFALERLGRADEAIVRYEAAAEQGHPRAADCWYYIGKNHLRQERETPAAAAFARAGSLPGARLELALLDARAGRAEQAETEARRLFDEFPQAYPPASLRYRLAVARGDPRAAALLADQFDRRPRPLPLPFDHEVEWVFATANRVGRDGLFRDAGREARAGRLAEAEANLRRALAAGWDASIADRLAEVVFQRGRPAEAVELLTEVVTRGRPSWESLWRLGQAYEAAGQPRLALEAWERAGGVATGPGAGALWQDLASRYERAGHRDRAARYAARAHAAAGSDDLDAGKLDAAAQSLTQAVGYDPGFAHAWYLLGETHRRAGRIAEARSAYERCLQANPDHGRALRALTILAE